MSQQYRASGKGSKLIKLDPPGVSARELPNALSFVVLSISSSPLSTKITNEHGFLVFFQRCCSLYTIRAPVEFSRAEVKS